MAVIVEIGWNGKNNAEILRPYGAQNDKLILVVTLLEEQTLCERSEGLDQEIAIA